MMREVERLGEVALLTNELIEIDDMRHVVREGDDADTHRVRVDVETERQSAREIHDQLILSLDAAGQVQKVYHVQH